MRDLSARGTPGRSRDEGVAVPSGKASSEKRTVSDGLHRRVVVVVLPGVRRKTKGSGAGESKCCVWKPKVSKGVAISLIFYVLIPLAFAVFAKLCVDRVLDPMDKFVEHLKGIAEMEVYR